MVAEPRSENLKKMEKELNEARARCKELEKAGAVEFSIGMIGGGWLRPGATYSPAVLWPGT
ncbi:hypothetical protein [Candidatus Ichthyocystis sparus]|uniref:hypothetical protein n=1 Tax=Candidatus Ichthyocystis sparus TaxID=1561004 RepID=UPI000B856D54|nr:hypothetical protein [Candidatus Ichthyocystis sparus]